MDLKGFDRTGTLPFISKYFENWTRLVFLRTKGGHLLPVARNLTGVPNVTAVPEGLLFEAISEFVGKYGDIISMGTELRWTMNPQIDYWLDRIIYLSFLCVSDKVTSNFWFLKVLDGADSRVCTEIPKAYHCTFEGCLKDSWVLLKSKGKVWPVRVTDNRFYEGWSVFWDDHNLSVGCTILFGARMKWIFEVIILGPNGGARNFHWAPFDDDVPECQSVEGLGDASITSCLPGILFGEECLFRFGYLREYGSAFYQVLAVRLEQLLITNEIENVVFQIQLRNWVVPVVGNELERTSLRAFVNDLKLSTWDYVFVAVVEASLVRIIVFGQDGLEKFVGV